MLLVWPAVEIATDDDFAYAKVAQIFAHTGHFVYNGWETTMLGWQVLWGALFIKLFGFSYLGLRFSTMLLGVAMAFLLHRVMLRCGVGKVNAIAGTLTVMLSPLLLPMAASYMTDVPADLCVLVCLYGCIRALQSANDRNALLWLCGSAAVNVVGGTVRQIAWLGALVMVPSAFWLLRGRRGFKMAGVIVWIGSAAGIALFMLWFSRQPYVLPEHLIQGPLTWNVPRYVGREIVYGPLAVLIFALPVFVAWLPELRVLSRRRRTQILVFCVCAAPLLLWADHYDKVGGRLPPWSANVVTRYGILWSIPLMGDHPEVLSQVLNFLLAVLLGASLLGFVLRFRRGRAWPPENKEAGELSLFETCVLALPFCIAYFALLLPRAAMHQLFSDVFDRYYLPLNMLAVLLLLRLFRRETKGQLPLTCYLILSFFSLFAVAATHDTFTGYRATARARAEVETAGVPGAALSGPWETDGANQIQAQGYLNDKRLENPPGAYRKMEHPQLETCFYWFSPLLPALHFKYVLTISRLKCLQPSAFPDVTYTTWLPPYTRTIYVERNPKER
jgi:hypothetical protein